MSCVEQCEYISDLYFVSGHVEKPNFVQNQKEDISDNNQNILRWKGLTCKLVRFHLWKP